MTWRDYQFVFVGDIEKMFRQILIHPEDQRFQLILWKFDENGPIFVFKIGTVIFGFVSSPFQADRTVKQLNIDYIIDHPWGAECRTSAKGDLQR